MSSHQFERRAADLEVRARGRRLEGYAAVFNARTPIAGSFDEQIAPGAFADSLASGSDILALTDHDPARVLGRTRNGSLRLSEDTRGLHFEIELPRTTLANDVLALAEAGSLGGASFGFLVKRDAWAGKLRTLHAVDLREISIISSWPAYPQTSVSARVAIHNAAEHYARRLRLLELGAA